MVNFPKSDPGAIAIPRFVFSIAASVVGLAIFLTVASLLLVSNPIISSFQDYFSSVDRVINPQSSVSSSFTGNRTQIFISEPISPQEEPKFPIFVDDGAKKPVSVSSSDSVEFDPNSTVSEAKSCDLYHGKWVYDARGPLYTNKSCPIITQMQNCQGNGRPDRDYENWRWKPDQCELPFFDGRKFLELMRGKTLAFVGDSVARNQMESLLCILWQVEEPKNRGNRRMHRWYFRSSSTMIVRIWSSWLVHKTSEPIELAPGGVAKVHLDLPDEDFMEFLPGFDAIVLSSGHWFAKPSVYLLHGEIVGGQLWKPPQNASLDMRISNIEAFGISVETAVEAIAAHPNFTGVAIIRSYSPDHYDGGDWDTGGSCTGKVSPIKKLNINGFTKMMHEKQVSGFNRAVNKAGKRSSLVFMDITEAFGYRPDGHPGPYRSTDPNKKTTRGRNGVPPPQDCLHWCMPGPIDTWNELLLEILSKTF